MKSPSMFPCRHRLNWSGAVALALAGVVLACGPEFPNSYYAMSDGELLAAPEGFFAAEIARLVPAGAPPHRVVNVGAKDPRTHTVEIDIAELKQALAERGVAQPDRIRWQYEADRRTLETWVEEVRDGQGAKTKAPLPEPPAIQFGAEVPAEFRLYLAGAIAWHQRRLDEARTQWRTLLELPISERRFRSVWATFMLGRLEVEVMERAKSWERAERVAANREAQRHLREARALVAEGFSDPLGLAAASFGWEARAALLTKDFSNAITLYLAQHAAGDASAVPSLQRAARSAVDSYPRDYEALVREPMVRRVVTAYFIARGLPRYGEPGPVPEQLKAWAIALEQADIGAVPDADRIAWLAYEAGLFALAQRWADIAPIDSPEAHWIRAKLALRSGNLRGGEKFLRTALESLRLGEAHRARINAELGRVCLAQDDFSGALSAALNGGHWEDAAFVAEKVMTLADLEAFVDRAVALKPEIILNSSWGRPENLTAALRHLLARRLARAGKAERAENYFSPEMRATYHAYVIAVQNGFDVTKPTAVRAEAFWNAAKIVRKDGMQLLGTELEPDWRIWEGLFETDPSAKARRNGPGNQGGVFAPTSVELTRLEKQTAPAKRFHYRYRAAELAWWSASLLPNDSDETAQILATAGGWLKARDPQAAQPFYQALVIRCGNTALGRAAATKHWFPAPPGPSGQ